MGDPDPFRLRHRGELGNLLCQVVRGGMDKRGAAKWIDREAATRIEVPDRARFIEMVETELGCLHVGNIARYRLRPAEFELWRKGWR